MKTEQKDKVSIIVPVYNVEKYIEKCVLSLVNQTYENCEILIINDGSPDNSLEIAEKISKKYKNIKIINQKNSGVSAARNNGLKNATGKYIVFVDADDFLADDFIEYMLMLIKQNDADFAYSIENFKRSGEEQTRKEFTKEISSDESVALLLSPKVTVGCWNKIYKKELLEKHNLFFSTDLFYGEGLQFIIDVSKIAKHITIGNRKVYYYRKNNISSATTKYSIQKFHNGEKSLKLIENKINLDNNYVKSMFLLHLSTFYLGAIVKLIENKKVKEYKEDYNYWKKSLRKNLPYILKSSYISFYRKLLLTAGLLFPKTISYLDRQKTKKNIASSVD